MKRSESLFRKYAPLFGITGLMLFVFYRSFLPALAENRRLERVRARRTEEIRMLEERELRTRRLIEALRRDPITIENALRRRFPSAAREGEVDPDRLPQ